MAYVVKNTFVDVEEPTPEWSIRKTRSLPHSMRFALKEVLETPSLHSLSFEGELRRDSPQSSTSSTSTSYNFAPEATRDGSRTLIVRNVPKHYTPAMLLEEWPSLGTYDILFMPCEKSGRHMGFAFVNFVSELAASHFRYFWQKKRLGRFHSGRPLSIGFADVQGRINILTQLQKKRPEKLTGNRCPMIFGTSNNIFERITLEKALMELRR
jgi:hypothetical protein